MSAPAIGIDLGTTYSCVAVYRNGLVEIIPNAEGNRITPSYVAFTDKERLVGDAAKDQDALNPANTIFDAKRLIGRKFSDSSVQDDKKYWPFEVINEDGKPKIKVQYKEQDKTLFPEEVSSIVLSKMKETAEAYLGSKVRNAVITVPAYFNNSQRQATKDAGIIAGLNVLRIINEPNAGALAYGHGQKKEEERNVLIYDLGGGTFDVSILTIEEGIFEVRSTAGNTHLGGEDFDNNVVEHFVNEFKKIHNLDISSNPRAIRRLRTKCEKAKRILSAANETSINIDSLMEGIDFHFTITRALFEKLNGDLIKSTLSAVENALRDADMRKSDIDEIVLVGGSTRIPMVQRLLQEFFGGKELNKSVNPDEAVAAGAAIQAANLDGEVTDMVLINITPLSLGKSIIGDRMSVIIERNSTIPTRKTKDYYTTRDYQTEIDFGIYEGERPIASDNNLLGEFHLTGIPPMLRGRARTDTTFEIDADGILHVTAETVNANNKKTLSIIHKHESRLSEEQIKQLVKEAEDHKLEDQKRLEFANAKVELELYCYRMESKAKQLATIGIVSSFDKQTILSKCNEIIEWTKSVSQLNIDDVTQRRQQLERICVSILGHLN